MFLMRSFSEKSGKRERRENSDSKIEIITKNAFQVNQKPTQCNETENFKKPKGRTCALFDTSEQSQCVKSNSISTLQSSVTPLVQIAGEIGQNPISGIVWCQEACNEN